MSSKWGNRDLYRKVVTTGQFIPAVKDMDGNELEGQSGFVGTSYLTGNQNINTTKGAHLLASGTRLKISDTDLENCVNKYLMFFRNDLTGALTTDVQLTGSIQFVTGDTTATFTAVGSYFKFYVFGDDTTGLITVQPVSNDATVTLS